MRFSFKKWVFPKKKNFSKNMHYLSLRNDHDKYPKSVAKHTGEWGAEGVNLIVDSKGCWLKNH